MTLVCVVRLCELRFRTVRFLGICPWERVPAVDSHRSGDKEVPPQHRLNATMRDRLREFYRPFNQLLGALVGGLSYNMNDS